MAAEVVEWIDPDGIVTELSVEWDTDGRFMPPIKRIDENVPLQAGARLRGVRHEARDVRLALWFDAASEAALRAELRAIVASMDPIRGEGRLRVTAPGGDQRELFCRYLAGLEMREVLGSTSGPQHQRAPAVFRAVDPYWYDVNTTTATYTTGATPASFFPIFPVRLSASEVFADATLDNTGDVETWPIWTVIGPGDGLVLRNLTTGKALSLDYAFAAGDQITIDTTPGVKTVLLDDGTNLFPDLTSTSSLWPIAQGSNAIRVELNSATDESSVTVVYKKRYLAS